MPQLFGLRIHIIEESSISGEANRRSALISIATDVHFWIPIVVLIAGLLLLHAIH